MTFTTILALGIILIVVNSAVKTAKLLITVAIIGAMSRRHQAKVAEQKSQIVAKLFEDPRILQAFGDTVRGITARK